MVIAMAYAVVGYYAVADCYEVTVPTQSWQGHLIYLFNLQQ